MAMIDDVLTALQITWEDAPLKAKLEQGIPQGKARINRYAGTVLDYESDEQARELLFAFMRYYREDAVEVFEKNYRADIIAIRENAQTNLLMQSEEST